jgi:hypothetical protein
LSSFDSSFGAFVQLKFACAKGGGLLFFRAKKSASSPLGKPHRQDVKRGERQNDQQQPLGLASNKMHQSFGIVQ